MLITILTTALLTTFSVQAVETRDKIALLDTGISVTQKESKFACEDKPVDFTSSNTYQDEQNHGSIIFNILASYIDYKKTCILSVKIFSSTSKDSNLEENMFKAFRYVDSERFKFFNLSFSGVYNSLEDFQLIVNLTKRGQVVVASGNDGVVLTRKKCVIYPVCYYITNNYHVASSIDCNESNRGIEVVDYSLKRSYTYLGSSMAVPHALGELINKYYKNKGE